MGIRNKNSFREKCSLYPRPTSVFTQEKSKFYPYSTHTHLPAAVLAQSLGSFKSNVDAAGDACESLASC